jgi:hypothetical protein
MVQVMPSGLVMTRLPLPELATATKIPLPYVTARQALSAAGVRMVQTDICFSVGDSVGLSVGVLVGDFVKHQIWDFPAHAAGDFFLLPPLRHVLFPSFVLKHPPSQEPSAGQDMISVNTDDVSASRISKLKSEITFALFILGERKVEVRGTSSQRCRGSHSFLLFVMIGKKLEERSKQIDIFFQSMILHCADTGDRQMRDTGDRKMYLQK